MNLPEIPASAPFSTEQRHWLNGYIAGLFAESGDGSMPVIASKPKLRVPVIYASQSGNAEGLAEEFSESLGTLGYDSPCVSAEDFSEIDFATEKQLLLISSTWGEGDPPDNAVEFWNAMQGDDFPKLDSMKYSVLSLGDTNYLDFCAQGIAFDKRLAELGATAIAPRVDCDVDFEEPAEAWFESVKTALAELDPEGGSADASPPPAPKEAKVEVKYSKKNPFRAKLKTNLELNATDSARDTRHFEFDLAGSGLSYEVGDVVGVYPKNDPGYIDEFIGLLGLDPEANVPAPDGSDAALRSVMIEYYDVRTLSSQALNAWLPFTKEPASTKLSELIAGDKTALDDYIWGRELIDLAVDFPANFDNPAEFVSILRKLGPRLYSISSSPKAHPDEVHLTIAKVNYETHGRERLGVCSTYLSDRVNGDGTVPIFLQTANHFRLPKDLSTDVIMCGPGTGIAPFRAFLEERESTMASGRNWLFFGNPHEETDFLYRDQLIAMRDNGVLNRLDLAWSRDGADKVYVQHRIAEAAEEMWAWFEGGAHFYVCGDAKRMAKDVESALIGVAETAGGLSPEDAAAYIEQLRKDKRYQRDVY